MVSLMGNAKGEAIHDHGRSGCPAAGSNTYKYQSAVKPAAYTVFCQGDNHPRAGDGPDLPSYNSRTSRISFPLEGQGTGS